MRLVATLAALWLWALPSARAQSNDWLVLPTTVEADAPWVAPTTERVGRELRRQGVGVWSSERAVAAFQARGSALPPDVSADDAAAWNELARRGLRALALGDNPWGLELLSEAQEFSRINLVTLNRTPEYAQSVLDTCLYLVRALAATKGQESAARQARECVQTRASVDPSPQMPPPPVLELFEAAQRVQPDEMSTLLVESEPSGCLLSVNGRTVENTPAELRNLHPGHYLVQVACEAGAEDRVHHVDVTRGSRSVFVSARFDRSVQTNPVLHLRYDALPEPLQLARDAREVARVLSASAVVVASIERPDVIELGVVSGLQVDPAMVRVPSSELGPDTRILGPAIAALLAGDCADFTGDAPRPIDCRTGSPTIALQQEAKRIVPPRGQFVSGATLASLGTASLLAGYSLLIVRGRVGDDWLANPSSLETQDKWLSVGTGLTVTASVGGGLLVAAMPLILPYKRKTPWWAWLNGGLGLVAAAGSIVSAVTASPKPPQSCSLGGPDPSPCVNRARDTDRAILLGATAAPLLTMPLVYLFRRSDKRLGAEIRPSIRTSRRGASVGLEGIF